MSCPILLEDDTEYLTEDSVAILAEACGDPPVPPADPTGEWVFEVRVRAPFVRSITVSPVQVAPGLVGTEEI